MVPPTMAGWDGLLGLAHARGGKLDSFDDLGVAGAAAEVAGESVLDLVAGGGGGVRQEGGAGDEEAGRAVAALRRATLGEGQLERVQGVVASKALDSGDGGILGFDGEQQAGEDRLAIHQHGAGATVAQLAAVLGASQVQLLTQHFEQGVGGRGGYLACLAVDLEGHKLLGHGIHSWAEGSRRAVGGGSSARARRACRAPTRTRDHDDAPRRSTTRRALSSKRGSVPGGTVCTGTRSASAVRSATSTRGI